MPRGVYDRKKEHRERMRVAWSGDGNPSRKLVNRQKLTRRMKGKQYFLDHKHTKEARRKISMAHKGKKFSEEHKKKLRENHADFIGENHPRWIKDRNQLAKRQERNDSAYREWTRKVKKRDSNICCLRDEHCSSYNIVHHIKDWAEYPNLRYEINNGVTLCQAHHPKRRAEEKRLEPILQALVSVSSD